MILQRQYSSLVGEPGMNARLHKGAHELTEDEYFCTEADTKAGVTFENTNITDPLSASATSAPK